MLSKVFGMPIYLVQNQPYQVASQTQLVRVVLVWKFQCATCVQAWLILYHVTRSCKGSIHRMFLVGQQEIEHMFVNQMYFYRLIFTSG